MLTGTRSISTQWAPREMLALGFAGSPWAWDTFSGAVGLDSIPGHCPPWEPRAAATAEDVGRTVTGPEGFTLAPPRVLHGVCLLMLPWDDGGMRGSHANRSLWGEQGPDVLPAVY